MAVKYHITTKEAGKIEERLKVIENEFLKFKVGAVEWKRRGNDVWISIDYLADNFLYDKIISRRFEGRLRKIDSQMVIAKL